LNNTYEADNHPINSVNDDFKSCSKYKCDYKEKDAFTDEEKVTAQFLILYHLRI